MKTQGIYAIVNTLNNKAYVGSSLNIERRWTTHLRDLRKGVSNSVKLQRAWNKYGESVWEWRILEEVEITENLNIKERHWIVALDSYAKGYNSLAFPGEGTRGKTITPAVAAKIVATRRANGTYKHSEETKRRLGDIQRGKKKGPMSEAQRKLLSEIRKAGVTDEMRKACGDRARGRVYTPEMRENMAAAHRGKVSTDHQKEAVSKALKGKKKDPESIRKMLLVKRAKGMYISCGTCNKYGIPYLPKGRETSNGDLCSRGITARAI